MQSNEQKQDKKLFNLDQKEVYEVFKHGAHYLREANKPEVQRTELNRIELSMPKKLVDTVMMLVNTNLKVLLGGRAHLSERRHPSPRLLCRGSGEFHLSARWRGLLRPPRPRRPLAAKRALRGVPAGVLLRQRHLRQP